MESYIYVDYSRTRDSAFFCADAPASNHESFLLLAKKIMLKLILFKT
jgi:hypothetical protein